MAVFCFLEAKPPCAMQPFGGPRVKATFPSVESDSHTEAPCFGSRPGFLAFLLPAFVKATPPTQPVPKGLSTDAHNDAGHKHHIKKKLKSETMGRLCNTMPGVATQTLFLGAHSEPSSRRHAREVSFRLFKVSYVY